ncbi:MAG: nucleotidyl transferase AbiEii/AbiGii toxin family protein [Myxococcota bacterium]
MDLLEELAHLVDALDRERVDFALCGGLAVNIYGHVRATKDIDLLVRREDVDRIRDAATQIGFKLRSGRIPFGAGTKDERELWRVSKTEGASLVTLDLLVVTPVFEPVWQTRQSVEWRGRRLGIVSLDGLARMKRLAARKQDLADLEALGLEKET